MSCFSEERIGSSCSDHVVRCEAFFILAPPIGNAIALVTIDDGRVQCFSFLFSEKKLLFVMVINNSWPLQTSYMKILIKKTFSQIHVQNIYILA